MDQDVFFMFCGTVTLLTLSPGPDIIFVLSQSIQRGINQGVLISLGLITGLFIYTMLSVFGLSWILLEYNYVASVIKLIGAIYLGYLAFLSLPVNAMKLSENKIQSFQNPYKTGLIMNLSNPKIMLFFLSLFPQFIFHKTLPINYQFFILGITFIFIAFIIFFLVSILAEKIGKNLKQNFYSSYFNYTTFLVLITISLSFFISEINNLIK